MSKHPAPPEGGGVVAGVDVENEIPTLDVRDSIPMWLMVLVVAVGFTAYAITSLGTGPILSFLMTAYSLWVLWRVVSRPPRLRITEEGIVDRTFWHSPGLIRWSEIVDIRPTRFWLLEIQVKDDRRFWENLNPVKVMPRALYPLYGLAPTAFSPWFLGISRRDLLEAMQAGLDAYTLAEGISDRDALMKPTDEAGSRIQHGQEEEGKAP